MNTNFFKLLMLSVAFTFGCSDDSEADAPVEEDPGEHACEHSEDAGSALAAAADPADAPELVLAEDPVTVSLPAEGDGFHGYLILRGPAESLLFVGEEAVVTSFTAGGAGADLLPEAAPNEFCPDMIPEHFDLDLEDGEYLLELGPATVDSVWLMFVDAAGHAHSP